ncbi:formylglycine-generating enzyme family protein [Micromonospora arida]|uniref:formylglycine-generating enzyme family protein n=1 Tax=Micromonospora arida TaxID=2203715 RepID=UPI0033A0B27A
MAPRIPVTIGALFLAPTTYRHLPTIGWAAHGEMQAELRWQLDHHFDSKIIVIADRRLGNPAAARRAIDDATKALGGQDVLLVCLAGHAVTFTRRDGDITALALPGSVPGRPNSMLRIDELSALVLPEAGKPVIVCADLVSTRDTVGAVAPAFAGAFVLASPSAADTRPESTCHDGLAAVLGDLAASGTQQAVPQLLDLARQRVVAAGGSPHLAVDASQAAITSRYVSEQLPDYVREDLTSPDPGSRLDAVTELAALAASTPFARASLLRLAASDRTEAVRSYADTMSRQDRQPSLRQLLADGVIPREVHEAALKEPAVPDLLPHTGGEVILGVDAPDGQDDCRPRHTVRLQPYRLARTVVTNRQYLAFLAAEGGPCPDHWQADDSLWRDDLPVVMVSWLDASRYCAWLTRHLHHTRALAPDQRIVLPSEAQWEASAGNDRGERHPWGDVPDPRRANIRATGIGAVVAPGRFSPDGDNEAGCQDLIGNVWEWTRSLWGHSGHQPTFGYPYRHDDGREMASTRPGERYVIRGGAFYYATECANSFTRNRMLATDRHPAGGFRVASTNARETTS